MNTQDLIVRWAAKHATRRCHLSNIPKGRMSGRGMISIDDTGEKMMTLNAVCEILGDFSKSNISTMLSKTDFFDACKVDVGHHIVWAISRASVDNAMKILEKHGKVYLRELFSKMIAGYSYEKAISYAIKKRDFKSMTRHEYHEHYERINKGMNDARKRNLERAGYRCEICGWQYADRSGVALTTHHIVEVRHGGDNSDENLICLCERCHKIVHQTTDYSMDDLRALKNIAANRP